MKRLLFHALAFAFAAVELSAKDHDLVVYGGTPGGIATAVAAAREGVSVQVRLHPGQARRVMINNERTDGYVAVDAVQFIPEGR